MHGGMSFEDFFINYVGGAIFLILIGVIVVCVMAHRNSPKAKRRTMGRTVGRN